MRPSVSWRTLAFAGTALLLVATFVHGWSVAVDDPQHRALNQMSVIERGEDYAVWSQTFAPRGHVSAFYVANGTPDRILLVRVGDIDAILRGDDVTPIAEFAPTSSMGPKTFGRLDFAAPSPDCPPPTGGCIDETVPALVWLKGDAWRGATRADAGHYSVLSSSWDGPVVESEPHEGPVHLDVSIARATLVANAPLWLSLGAIGGGVAILAALAHAIVELRRERAPLVPPAPRAESTETMLMLARLTTLYVDAIRRSFLVSLAAIVGITTAVLFFGLPPMLEQVSAQFRHLWELQEQHVALFTLAPVTVMVVALTFWAVAYARVRRELKEWRRRAAGFDEQTERVLGA